MHLLSPCLYTLFLCFYEGGGTISLPLALDLALPFIHRWKVLTAVPPLHEPPSSIEIMGKCNNWGGAGRTIPAIVCRSFQFLGWISVGGPTPKVIPMIYWTEDICAISLIVSLTGLCHRKSRTKTPRDGSTSCWSSQGHEKQKILVAYVQIWQKSKFTVLNALNQTSES